MNQFAVNQFALLSLPSCGTEWLMGCIERANPAMKYQKEFFHPLWNSKHHAQILRFFGSELYEAQPNIGVPWRLQMPGLDDVYRETWCKSDLNATKEVFSPCKLGWFHQYFTCAVLCRPWSQVFPPSRMRVIDWYNSIYHSLSSSVHAYPGWLANIMIWCGYHADTMWRRSLAAHVIGLAYLIQEAHGLGIRPLFYQDLMFGDQEAVETMLDYVLADFNPFDVAREVLATRDPAKLERDNRFLPQWADAFDFAGKLQSVVASEAPASLVGLLGGLGKAA